ncbi:MAG: hypothetical protein GTO18_08165 [Anaerolineales bacterium]|nr:hypothetical protein [Anaerolineales bacterium]
MTTIDEPVVLQDSHKIAKSDRPYTPSWVDRLTDWIEALPGPSWIIYLVLFFLSGSLNQLVAWIAGTVAWGEFDIYLFLNNLFTVEILFFFKFLDEDARKALEEYRPLLSTSEEDYTRIEFELTNQPARPVMLWTIIGVLLGFSQAYSVGMMNNGTIELSPLVVYEFIGFAVPTALALVFVYRIIRQLRIVNGLYESATEIDLFNLDPVYALSSHTAKTGLIFLLLVYTNLLLSPQSIQIPTALMITIVISALSFSAFILPLRGINQRLVSEKKNILREIHLRIKKVYARIDSDVDNDELDEMDRLDKTTLNLERQKAFVEKIPTWPWQPATIRGYLSAMFLPILIWIIQQVLERLFNI